MISLDVKAKPQFKNAQKYGAKVVITLGEEELETKTSTSESNEDW